MTTPQITIPSDPPNPLEPQPTFRATFYTSLVEILTAMGQQNTMATWMNTTAGTVSTDAGTAVTKAAEAVAAQIAAEAAKNNALAALDATIWVSGGSYTAGDTHYSPTTFQAFRATQDHSGRTTEPQDDPDYWTKAVADEVGVGGVVMAYGDQPSPWLRCDGSTVLVSAYPQLAEVIGDSWPYTFGSGASADTNPTGAVQALAVNDDDTVVAAGHSTSPFVSIYDFDGTDLTKQTNPATLPAGTGRHVSFSPNGDILAVGHDSSPFVTFYDMTQDPPLKMPDPASLPPTHCYWTSWSANSRYCYVASIHASSTNLTIYDFNLGYPVATGSIASLMSGQYYAAETSPDGAYLVVGSDASPYLRFYDLTDPTTPVALSDPASMPSARVAQVSWSPDSRYVVTSDISGSDTARVYDMNSGAPVLVTNGDAVDCRYGVAWYGNDRFATGTISADVDLAVIADGALSVVASFTDNDIYGGQGRYFKRTSDGANLFKASSASPYLERIARAFDPATQFVLPDIDLKDSSFVGSAGGPTGLPAALWIKGD